MGIIDTLKGMQEEIDSRSTTRPKTKWFSLKAGASTPLRFLQELDKDSPLYDEERGTGILVSEHVNPADYLRKFVCTRDEGKCYGCELARAHPRQGFGSKIKLYVNVLVPNEDGEEEVAILSQGTSGKAITTTLIEYAKEDGQITNSKWNIKRTGAAFNDTSYALRKTGEFTEPLPAVELYNLREVAIRLVDYDDQAEHFGEVVFKDTPTEETTSADW